MKGALTGNAAQVLWDTGSSNDRVVEEAGGHAEEQI